MHVKRILTRFLKSSTLFNHVVKAIFLDKAGSLDFGKKKSRRKEKACGGFHKTLFWEIWHSNAFSHLKRLL